jgi:hypothetical protein
MRNRLRKEEEEPEPEEEEEQVGGTVVVSENRSTEQVAPQLTAAMTLVAAYEACRRLRAGDDIDDPAKYVRIRAERLSRDNARLFASMPDPDPLDFARGIEPRLAGNAEPEAPKIRVINGVEHRHIIGTGWCPPLPRTEEDAA